MSEAEVASGESDDDHAAPSPSALLAQTRRRAARIDRYVDLIPARFYIGSEALQASAARASAKGPQRRNCLDPAQYVPTSQLVAEAAAALSAAAFTSPTAAVGRNSNHASGSSPSGHAPDSGKDRRKKQRGRGACEASDNSEAAPNSRAELRSRLERRIRELREERKRKQSACDTARVAAQRAAEKRPAPASAAPSSRGGAGCGAAADGGGDDMQAGRLTFEPKRSHIPFEAGVNRRGSKVRQLRASLRSEEDKRRRVAEADGVKAEELKREFGLRKALLRAKGEKVHDDVHRLRKVQKSLESRKRKGKEKWASRVEQDAKMQEERQQQRKENLQNRSSAGRNRKVQRNGFEGNKDGYLNADK